MKYAFLVAWREYAESIKAKGFWISIFLMPTLYVWVAGSRDSLPRMDGETEEA